MIYNNIKKGIFLERPNRFIAHVLIDGKEEIVHVKNTGRCRELLIKGVEVILEYVDSERRKTKYDLIAVYKKGLGLINMDSQAPNKVVYEYLVKMGCQNIKKEFTYGHSRLDFYFEYKGQKSLMEVKGCTLEIDGIGYFPDAPTQRGTKHILSLIDSKKEGYTPYIAFVIQMPNIKAVLPNKKTDVDFSKAIEEGKEKGVKILNLTCDIEDNSLKIISENLL